MRDTKSVMDVGLATIERRSNWNWLLVGVLLVALAAGTAIFYLFGREFMPADQSGFAPEQIAIAAGIFGLVLIFGLSVWQKQRQLNRLRAELIQTQIFEETFRSRLSELSSLFDVSGEVNLQLELQPVLDLITRRVLTCVEADRSSIFLLDEATNELACHSVSGARREQVDEARIPIGEGISGWVAENNEPLVLNDDDSVRRFATEIKPGRGIATALCVPLASGGKVVGVMNLSRLEHSSAFTASHARLLTVFGEHVAATVLRIRQYEALDQKAGELEAAYTELARLNRLKQVFLATVNHELRGPMTSILAYAEFLAHNEEALDPNKRQTFSTILYDQARRLQELIGQITDLSRVEDPHSQIQLASVSLNEIIADVFRSLAEAAAGKGVTLLTRLDPVLPAFPLDRKLLNQGVRTFLSNAIRYSETGSDLRITTQEKDDHALISVTGTGIAIAPEDMVHIFELLDRGEQVTSRHIEGLGLGLHMIKRVVEMHGGRAWAEGSKTKGSSFYFSLPKRATAAPPAPVAGNDESGKIEAEPAANPAAARAQAA